MVGPEGKVHGENRRSTSKNGTLKSKVKYLAALWRRFSVSGSRVRFFPDSPTPPRGMHPSRKSP